RVWANLGQPAQDLSSVNSYSEGINTMNPNSSEQIHGCDDFQSLIPAYLDGKLSTARKLLLEDHSNECLPCRHEIKAQRNLAAAKKAVFVAPQHKTRTAKKPLRTAKGRWGSTNIARWSVAAGLAI